MALPTSLLSEINEEHDFAISHFPPFASAHEGLAIIQEEFEELKAEVFRHQSKRDIAKLRKEALQVATMAARFIIDVCSTSIDEED